MAHNNYIGPYVQGINPIKTIYERGEEVSIVSFFDCFGSKKSYPHNHTLYTYYQIDGVTYGQAHSVKSHKEEMVCKLIAFKIPFNAKTVKYRTSKSGPWISIKLKDPSPPTNAKFNNPTNYIHESSFKLEWNQSNFNTDPGHYELQKRINGGTWTDIDNNLTSTIYNFDINTISRGDIIDFRVRAVNSFGASSWETSSFKRNRIPNTVTNILPMSGFTLNQVEIRWTEAKNIDNKTYIYNIYISKNNEEYKKIATVSNCTYTLSIPVKDLDGTTYSVKIETVDNLGCANSIIGPTYIKPGEPSAPINLGPIEGYYESYIDFSWTISNNYSVYGSYMLDIFVNKQLYRSEIISGADTKYRLVLSNIDRGSEITYRIKAIDTFNRESDWSECDNLFRYNNKPKKPCIILPNDSAQLYSKRPKFVLKTSKDIDIQELCIKIKVDDTIYDSKNNSDSFSKSIINGEEYIIFKPSSEISVGIHNISVYMNDGLVDSDSDSITIKILDAINPFILGDFIKADSLNNYIDMLNINLKAYGVEEYDFKLNKIEYISAEKVNLIIEKIDELNAAINKYHLDNKFSNQIFFVPIEKDITIISYEILNNLFKSII